MPHQCTSCGHVFDDGSKEMLSGCPDCGGTKFQFHPDGADIPEEPPGDADPPDPPAPDSPVAGSVGSAAATVRDLVGAGSGGADSSPAGSPESGRDDAAGSPPDPVDSLPPDERVTGVAGEDGDRTPGVDADDGTDSGPEDAAQASARADVVSRDELPDRADPDRSETSVSSVEEPDETDRPDLSELRAELNEQFESIKIVEPGQYELNLMELYDREEYIVALEEDGRYSIQVPETWRD